MKVLAAAALIYLLAKHKFSTYADFARVSAVGVPKEE